VSVEASPDRFGPVARAYAEFRPRYPRELFERLSRFVARHELAWDCATGNGQAAVALASYFDRVVATDFSAGQLACATASERVSYIRARAEAAPLRAGSTDLVTVAQALHWFDIDLFWREVRRILRPDGVVAVWCYNMPHLTTALDRILDHYYGAVVGRYWARPRVLVERGYATVPFPFDPIEMPPFEVAVEVGIDELIGYAGTWSATIAYQTATGENPIPALRDRLEREWPSAGATITARWPVTVRVGRIPASAA